jgi:ABC-type antimicrobial peptide transport system permease subunit
MREVRREPRFRALLFVSFAVVALILAAVGLYGTLAHAVSRRTRELGIRMAVGADRRRIFAMVLSQGLRVTGTGLLIGLIVAAVATRSMRSFLFGVQPLDPVTFGATALVLILIAGVAMYRPARRATRVQPMASLRAD